MNSEVLLTANAHVSFRSPYYMRHPFHIEYSSLKIATFWFWPRISIAQFKPIYIDANVII